MRTLRFFLFPEVNSGQTIFIDYLLMLIAFKKGILTGFRQWRIAGVVYCFQLLLAAALGVQVYQVLEASIGNSLELDKLLGNYDHTVISDLIHVHGASISPLIGQLRWVILIYLVFSVFINAGILYAVVQHEKGWVAFWQGGAMYFSRFFRIGLLFLLLTGIISAAIWVPFLPFFMISPEYFSSEKISVWLLLLVVFFYLLLLLFLFTWSLTTRIMVIRDGSRIIPAFSSAFGWSLRHYFLVTRLVFLFFLLHLFLFFIYWVFNNPGVVSLGMLLVFIFFQQVIAYLRIVIRVMVYGAMAEVAGRENHSLPTPPFRE